MPKRAGDYPGPNEYIYKHLTTYGEDYVANIYKGYKTELQPWKEASRQRKTSSMRRICSYSTFRDYIALYVKHGYLKQTRIEIPDIRGAVTFEERADELQAVHEITNKELPFHPRRYYQLTSTTPLPMIQDLAGMPVSEALVEEDAVFSAKTFVTEQIKEKWRKAKSRNIVFLRRDMDRLASLGVDVRDLEGAIADYQNVVRGDYDSKEEYQEDRDDTWEYIIDVIEDIEPNE